MFELDNFIKYSPEIAVLLSAILGLRYKFAIWIGLFLTLIFLMFQQVVVFSAYILLFKILLMLSTGLVLLMRTKKIMRNGFNTLVMFSLFFLFMVINSNNYLSLYMNIEFYSICLYFLISYDKQSYLDSFKYFVTSIVSSLFMLLGVSFLYGITGSVDFMYIEQFAQNNNNYSMSTYILPYLLIFSGLFFKLGLFPFAHWLIDLYKHLDIKVLTYISTVPKLGICAVLIKVLNQCISFEISFLLIILALFTALFGIFYGFRAKNIMTIMACSSYLNLSYVVIALSLFTRFSIATVFFYLLVYIFMNIGALSGIATLKHSNVGGYEGVIYNNKSVGICFLVCLISLLGFPITSGFISKIYLLAGILNSGIAVIPVILFMILTMVSAVIFYIRPVNGILKKCKSEPLFASRSNKIILYSCAVITMMLGLFPIYFIRLCEVIASYL